MYELSAKTKKLLEQQTKAKFSDLTSMTLDEEIAHVKRVTGKSLTFSKERKKALLGRGSPLIAQHRLRTMEDVDRGLEEFLK